MHLTSPAASAIGLGVLALFILYGSAGPWSGEALRTEALPGLSLPDIAQNVLLYIPFGVLGVWASRGLRTTRSARFLGVMAIAFAYGTAMELLQRRLAGRIASPLDVVANLVGAATGIALAKPAGQALTIAAGQIKRTGLLSTPLKYLLAALLATILLSAWYPFDITPDISTLAHRTRPIRLDPWLRPAASKLWAEAASFGLLAATALFCMPRLGKWAAPLAFIVVVLVAGVVDLGQLWMGSQPIGLAAFASQSAGALVGAVFASTVRRTEYAAA